MVHRRLSLQYACREQAGGMTTLDHSSISDCLITYHRMIAEAYQGRSPKGSLSHLQTSICPKVSTLGCLCKLNLFVRIQYFDRM